MKLHAVLACALSLVTATLTTAAEPEYLASFDPAKGFKPAQRDLTEVYLQIAGSLENYGSPESYLRHMASEHARIETLYRDKFGAAPKSFRPEYMTDLYLNRLVANWNLLSPKLGLDSYAKEVGHSMRDAIKGTRGTGTIIVALFNRHQEKVFEAMKGAGSASADFETLKATLVAELEIGKGGVNEERYEVARRDAVSFALGIHGTTMKLFDRLDQGLKPADAARLKSLLTSIIMDIGQMAQSELEAGIAEWALSRASTVSK